MLKLISIAVTLLLLAQLNSAANKRIAKNLRIRKCLLSDGNQVPKIGFGTYRLGNSSKETAAQVKEAVYAGYRHIDTALLYLNEEGVGQAIRELINDGVVSREDLFITGKVWNTYHSRPRVMEAALDSLKNLGLEYLDLFLIHWPTGWEEKSGNLRPTHPNGSYIDSGVDYLETWKGMEDVWKQGLARSIGVSNFNRRQLQRILDNAEIKPVVNQFESHPYLPNEKLLEFNKRNDVQVISFSPLAHGNSSLLNDPVLRQIGKKYGKSPAQVAIRFQLQRGVIPIPKSSKSARMAENLDVFNFRLSADDMRRITGLNKNFRVFPQRGGNDHQYYPFRDAY